MTSNDSHTSATVVLVDVDCKPGFPNLALMRWSTYEKSQGAGVFLSKHRRVRPDGVRLSFPLDRPRRISRAHVSCVFSWNRDAAATLGGALGPNVDYGGPGWGFERLPDAVEQCPPDYSLYQTDKAVGFVNRGCFRSCGFCNVPRLEGRIREDRYSPPWTWVPDGFSKCLLLDNEFAYYDPWRQQVLIEWFRAAGVKYSLTQGYDLRILARQPELASLLAENKPWDDAFAGMRLYCAWDYVGNEPAVRRGIEALLGAGFRGQEISCYCIVGGPADSNFYTTHAQDVHRVLTLWREYSVYPFVMKFNNRRDDPCINRLAHLVNRPARFKDPSVQAEIEAMAEVVA